MSLPGPRAALAGFLTARVRGGDDGKTFLVGYADTVPAFAVAAGLRDTTQHEQFARFARYLLHQRFSCDGHVLMLPAEIDGQPVYVVEQARHGAYRLAMLDADMAWRESPPAAGSANGLIGDLAAAESGLPGIMRRSLDQLFEDLQVAPPAA